MLLKVQQVPQSRGILKTKTAEQKLERYGGNMNATEARKPKYPTILLDNQLGQAEFLLNIQDFEKTFRIYVAAANRVHAKGFSGVSLKLGIHRGNFVQSLSGEFRFKGRLLADIHFGGTEYIIEKNPKRDPDCLWYPVRRETPLAALIEFLERRAKKLQLK